MDRCEGGASRKTFLQRVAVGSGWILDCRELRDPEARSATPCVESFRDSPPSALIHQGVRSAQTRCCPNAPQRPNASLERLQDVSRPLRPNVAALCSGSEREEAADRSTSPLTEYHGPFDDILESRYCRPRIAHQRLHGVSRNLEISFDIAHSTCGPKCAARMGHPPSRRSGGTAIEKHVQRSKIHSDSYGDQCARS